MTAAADFYQRLSRDLDAIRAKGLYKTERIIASAQGATVKLEVERGAGQTAVTVQLADSPGG